MDSPFVFGKTICGENFVNRDPERQRLKSNFRSGINTILMSPRRYGKSSLILQVALEMKSQSVKFIFIDLFNIRSEEEFYSEYLKQTLKCTLSKKDELLKAGKSFFKKLVPVISFNLGFQENLSVSLNWEEAKKLKDEILNLPEQIGMKKGYKIVVCIDEFQNICNIPDSLNIEKELRSYWQHHKQVAYCLYGSKRHMMKDIFNKEDRPFYRFGDLISLERISEKNWMTFIHKAFTSTGKKINIKLSESIVKYAESHSYYVQQLSHMVWYQTQYEATVEIVNKSILLVIETNVVFYKEIVEQLSNTQIAMLKAACDGVIQFSSTDTMKKYHLGTLNNITKNKDVLEKKDIIELNQNSTVFVDPFFKLWFIGLIK